MQFSTCIQLSFYGCWSRISVIKEAVECRPVIKFLQLKCCTPKETIDEIKVVHVGHVPSYNLIKHLCQSIRGYRTSVERAPNPRRPHSTIDDNTINKVEANILQDDRITYSATSPRSEDKCSVPGNKIVQEHFHTRMSFPGWILWMFTPFQKRERVNCSQTLLVVYQENNWLNREHETWVHHYDSETEVQL